MRFLPLLAVAALSLAACKGGEPECAPKDKFDAWIDEDGDGFGDPGKQLRTCSLSDRHVRETGDCDDSRADINPAAEEQCNGIDDDCDGRVDEFFLALPFYRDDDGDGWGSLDAVPVWSCVPPAGHTDLTGDCDDTNPGISPAGTEVCNGVDDDCDGRLDDEDPSVDPSGLSTYYRDADGDTYGDPNVVYNLCAPVAGAVTNNLDCNDNQALANPDATEICNGFDDDCDGLRDDEDAGVDPSTFRQWYLDLDGDGFGDATTLVEQCSNPAGYIANGEDCDDNDDQIRGPLNWLSDLDGDGYGIAPSVAVDCVSPGPYHAAASLGVDCDDADPNISPGVVEICNGFDDNCDGRIDDNDPTVDVYNTGIDFYPDTDGDGHGSDSVAVRACQQPPGAALTNLDCDDSDPAVNPDATEVCNDGIDDDCDGDADDADASLDPTSLLLFYEDIDLDGYGTNSVVVAACAAPPGFASAPNDCDDFDAFTGAAQLWFQDTDMDGAGDGVTLWPGGPLCAQPALDQAPLDGGVDCDDNDPQRFPSNPEICADGIDQDCSGAEDCDLLFEDWETAVIDPAVWEAPFGDAMVVTTQALDGWSLQMSGPSSTVQSLPFDTSGCSGLDLSVWIKRGPVGPGVFDNLSVDYWDGFGWQNAQLLAGTGGVDPTFLQYRNLLTDPGAMGPDFALRVVSTSPSGQFKPFYVDDLALICL